MKGQPPLPPPPRERKLEIQSALPPPPSQRKGFASNINSKPISNSELEKRIPTSRSSSLNVEPDDAFFIAAKNNIIKKLELEELNEELESAKYEQTLKTPEYSKIFPPLANIYNKTNQTPTIDDLLKPSVSNEEIAARIEEIGKRIKEKETELNTSNQEYNKPDSPNDIQSEIISFNETLDSYLENKKNLMAIKPDIESKMKEAIKTRNVLTIQIGEDKNPKKQKTEEQQKKDVNEIWKPNFKIYDEQCKEISNLFNIKNFLDKNTELYNILNHLPRYIDKELFHRAIYNRHDLSQRFNNLKVHVFQILKNYTLDNDHFMIKLERKGSTFPGNRRGILSNHKKKHDRLEDENKELKRNIDELTQKFESNVELRLKEITDKLEQKQSELTQLKQIQDSSNEEKETKIVGLQAKLAESEKNYQEAMANLKKESNEKNGELMEKMTEEHDNMKKEIERLQALLKTKPEELTDKIKTKEEEVQLQQETNEFLLLVIKAADLYEKDEFKDGFDDLLKYQPDDKFMFNYAFSQIEQGDYKYLDNFLMNQDKIPEKIYEDPLILQIKGTLAFKPASQMH